MLKKNLERQSEIKATLTELTSGNDEHTADEDIDEAVKPIVNETHSPAIAAVLAKMWKEMRTYERPTYQKQLMEDLNPLEKGEHVLELELNATESNLTAAKAEFAKEDAETDTDKDGADDDADEDGAVKANATAALVAGKDTSADALLLHAQPGEVSWTAPHAKKTPVHSGALALHARTACFALAVLSSWLLV